MKHNREQIEQEPITINLKSELFRIRNTFLDYLVDHDDLNDEMRSELQRAERLLSKWTNQFVDYLITDNEYYCSIAQRILGPVFLALDDLEGIHMELDEERDSLFMRVKELEDSRNSDATWVKVSDRLPDECQKVLVSWKIGEFQYNELAWIEYEEDDNGEAIGDPKWFDKDSSTWTSSPEFWMPIPKQPDDH